MNRKGHIQVTLAVLASTVLAMAASAPIYDEKADAHQQIAAAISEASPGGKNIILIFGANW